MLGSFVLIRMLDIQEITGVKNVDCTRADVKCNRMLIARMHVAEWNLRTLLQQKTAWL
jgi:hypothetical protein